MTNSLLLNMAIYSEFSHTKMVIFHSYVSLPEGNPILVTVLIWRALVQRSGQQLDGFHGRHVVPEPTDFWNLA